MAKQIHKSFTNDQVKDLFKRYLNKELKRTHVQTMLKIGKSRFFALLRKYRKNPDKFSIAYERTEKTRTIDPKIEKNILKELKSSKQFIQNKDMPITTYNYSFIKQQLEEQHNQKVSLNSIINRAKKYDFYLKRSKRKAHDREVITNHVGELTQQDSSLHLFSPYAKEKWYLITALDDFSRYIFYAMLVPKDTSWAHIQALQSVFITYGLPLKYYVDSHRIFRFVQGRDSVWRNHKKFTDDVDTQWQQVLKECSVDLSFALSPQAKGKIERPYRWIQDHLVRICARDNISTIGKANQILWREVYLYNNKWIHSTTREIPYLRFQRAIKEKISVLRNFKIPPPFLTVKDVFCLRIDRTVDPYRQVALDKMKLKVNKAPIGKKINLRIHPNEKSGLADVRFWYKDQLLDSQKVQNRLLKSVHF